MNEATTARNTAPRTQKARAPRCARCNRVLTRPGTVVPGLGVVGPECEQHVTDRLLHLQRQGLGQLLQGEYRVAALRNLDGTYSLPGEAYRALSTIADRAGRLSLDCRFDPGTREWVIRIRASTLAAFVKRVDAVAA